MSACVSTKCRVTQTWVARDQWNCYYVPAEPEPPRNQADVPFEYNATDPQDVARKVREILDTEPGATGFRVSGHQRDGDGNGYFQVSWRTEK